MKFQTSLYAFALSCALVSGGNYVFAGAIDELSQADQNRVKNGEQVFIHDETKPWPKCTVYQRVEATPEEAAAVFADYNLHASYFPNLTQSKIVRALNKTTMEIDYTMKLPLGLGSENYTVRDVLSSYDSGNSYKVMWSLVKGDSMSTSDGSARFEKLGNGTLLVYYSFIVPTRWGSSVGWVVDGAKKAVKDAVTALVKQIEKEKVNEPGHLEIQLKNMRTALGE